MNHARLAMRFAELTVAGTALIFSTVVFAQVPSIEGAYKLVSRTLPDGRVQRPPEAMGLMTFTKTHRNFNIVVKDATGKHFSLSLVSTYKLTDTQFEETLLFRVLNDQIGGKEIVYDLSGKTATSPVKIEGRSIEFKFPFEVPTASFEGDKITARTPAGLVAVWEKVQ
jgi:hypothetical protein